MGGIQLITVISEQGAGERCMAILRERGCEAVLTSAGVGTATGEMLRLLGMSRTEKELTFALCASGETRAAMTALVTGR